MATLITGAAGFIGYHLARHLLARGDRVIGLDNLNDAYSSQLKKDRIDDLNRAFGSGFTFLRADFAEAPDLQAALESFEFETIAHFGAQAGVRYSLQNPHAFGRSNLMGHLNILELARSRRIKHLVYASSSSVYGANTSLPFRVEDRVDHPISLYAATKKADELMSETYAHLFRLPQTGLRFFTVYGPWGRPDMAMWIFTRNILRGEPIKLFNHGQMRRDFTYIDDIISGVVAAHDAPPSDDGAPKPGGSLSPHRLYNIGNSRSEEIMRMVEILEQACGRRAIVELLPMQPGDVRETCADISAIERDLGFRPKTLIDEGVPRFVEWFQEYHSAVEGAAGGQGDAP